MQYLLLKQRRFRIVRNGFIRFEANIFAFLILFRRYAPNLIMLLAFNVLHGFAHHFTERLIDLQMTAFHILEPNKTGHSVHHRLQAVAGMPQFLLLIKVFQEMLTEERPIIIELRKRPYTTGTSNFVWR